jgi:spore germination protein YaaH
VGPGQIITFAPVVLPLAPHIRENVAERVQTHGAAHDASVGSSYYMVPQADRSCRVGWFEDWWSLSRKTGWVLDKGVAGLAVFPLGYDGGELVEMAARRFRSPGGKRP